MDTTQNAIYKIVEANIELQIVSTFYTMHHSNWLDRL